MFTIIFVRGDRHYVPHLHQRVCLAVLAVLPCVYFAVMLPIFACDHDDFNYLISLDFFHSDL